MLENFSNPNSIRDMSIEELNIMSQEIREFLIESISKTGGHLAPNLGVVELTIALHNVFDFSKDKVIFDVGHQSYVHKILTGRKDKFDTLRKYKGLAGFPKTSESIYDHFNTGHASTSISAALGMARARDLKGEDYSVLCVIGDGALTGGLAWEAMNDVGLRKTPLIIVLNDNEMSISRNVGGVSLYLSQLRSDIHYEKLKKGVQKNLEKIPMGKTLTSAARWVKDSFKAMVVEGMVFENIGIKYLGPVDGHNIKDMSKILKAAKDFNGPVLIHCLTQKGKGYEFAVAKPDKFHGIAPFDKTRGEISKKSSTTYSKAFGETVLSLGKEHREVVAITAAMRDGTGLTQFSLELKDQFFDVGIAEEHAVTMAAGMAINGLKPYVAIYSTFLQRTLDQLIHDIALQNLNVTFCVDRAGLVGDDGETHQGIFDVSFLSIIPNIVIMAPKSTDELRNLIKWSYSYNEGPLVIRYPRGEDDGKVVLNSLEDFKPGVFEVIKEGRDIAIVTFGKLIPRAYVAATNLEEEYDITLINATSLKPLDRDYIKNKMKDYRYILTMEDNSLKGGLGEGIAQILMEEDFKGRIVKLGFDDTYVEQGDVELLLDYYDMSVDKIMKRIREDNSPLNRKDF